ncbi:PAS domain S-box protein [Leptolyngbyaceae cyanobacterium UHCC 1019]
MEKSALKPQFPPRIHGIPLRLVLILPFVLQVVGAVGLTGYLSFRNGQVAINSFATQLTSQVGDRIQERIRTYLETPQSINKINLDAVEAGVLNLKNFEQVQRQFWGQKRFLESVTTIYYANEARELISVANLSNGRSYLSTLTQGDRGLRRIYLLNDYGTIKSLLKTIPKYDPRLRPGYTAAKQAGKSVWSPIFQYQFNSRVAISFASPLFEPTGKFKGVLVSELHLEEISRFLQKLDISRGGQAFLVERSGELVATSTSETPFRLKPHQQNSDQQKSFRLPATRSQNFLTQATAEYLKDEFRDLKAIAEPKNLSFVEDHQRNFVRVVPYQDKAGLDWLIVVVVPEADFIADISRSNQVTIHLMIAALAGSLALGLVTTYWITKPISQLSQASQDLALDRLENPVDENSPIAELEILAYTFNQMTAYLQESFEEVKDALQESEERFAKIFRASPDPISLRSFPEGKYLEVNDSFVNLLEYSREDIIGHSLDHLGTWVASFEEQQQAMQTLNESGRLQGMEIEWVTSSGKQIFLLASCELVELDGQRCLLSVGKDITDRKRLEVALKKSEAKLSDILNSSEAAICCFKIYPSDRCQYEYFSPSHETMFGFSPAEIMADSDLWLSRVHPDDYDKLFLTYSRIPETRYFSAEYRFCRKDGCWRWIVDYMTFRRDETDSYWLATIAAVDITDRKQLELALQQSEAKLNQVLDTATIAICSYDLYADGHIEYDYFSPNNERVFGYLPEELFADTRLWFSRVHPDDRHKPVGVIPPTQAETVTTEYRFYHKNGSLRWIADQVTFRRDDVKNCWSVTAAAIDISDRKQIEASLRQQEASLREAQRIAHIGSWELEVATNQVLLSEELFHMFGIAPSQSALSFEQIVGQMIHSEDRDRFRQVFQTAIAAGTAYKIDLRFLRPDGSICHAENRGKPIFNEIGQVVRMVGTSLDITARKEIEARFEQLSATIPGNIYTVVQSLDGRVWFEYMSAAIEAIHELPASAILNDAALLFRCIHPEDVAAYQAAVAHSAETLTLFKHEWRVITPSGKLKWLQGTSRPEQRTNGDTAWHGIVMDISERKQVEAALQAQELCLRQVIDAVPSAIFVKDREGRYLMVNQAFADIYDTTIAAIVGKRDVDFNSASAQVENFRAIDQEVMQTRQSQIISPKAISTAQGKLRWHQVNLHPLIDADNQVQGVIGSAIDITELVQLETMLATVNGTTSQVKKGEKPGFHRTKWLDIAVIDIAVGGSS